MTSRSDCAVISSVTTRRTTIESSTTSTRIFSMLLILKCSQHRELCDKYFRRERFHHVLVGARRDRPLHLLALRLRCNHHDSHWIPNSLSPHGVDEFKSV